MDGGIRVALFAVLVLLLSSGDGSRRVKRIVGGKFAAPPPPDDPVVFIRKNDKNARVEGMRNPGTGLYSFLGMRYAQPPIGENRFQRPKFRRLEGDVNATRYGPPCPQPHPYQPNTVVGNEDCLLLNVFTPRMPDGTTGLPVVVWIHGGGFRYGSASQYGAEPLTQGNVLFVPVQYRLGTLGIIGDRKRDFSGNLAMLDMTVALRWITDYIAYFGGDPKQIKVVGHGSGANSAMLLSMSRMSRSSVSGVVSMSGSSFSQYALDEKPMQSMDEVVNIHGCSGLSEKETIICLKKKPLEEIVTADSKVQTERLQGEAMMRGMTGGVGFSPHVEQPDDDRGLPGFLTTSPEKAVESHSVDDIPLLVGVTKDETANGVNVNKIESLFGSIENFLNSTVFSLLSNGPLSVASNLTNDLLKPVVGSIGLSATGLQNLLQIPPSLNPQEIFNKVTETTTDVLFSLPAVLSASVWGKVAPSFLYSFEYLGEMSFGKKFLGSLPIVSENSQGYVAHGDELPYLFDVNDIFGNPIPEAQLTSKKDLDVRKKFTAFISSFAHLNLSASAKSESNIFKPFSTKSSPFIKITEKVELSADFRFCQLVSLGLQLTSLSNINCANVVEGLAGIGKTVGGTLGGTLGVQNQSLPSLGILGGGNQRGSGSGGSGGGGGGLGGIFG